MNGKREGLWWETASLLLRASSRLPLVVEELILGFHGCYFVTWSPKSVLPKPTYGWALLVQVTLDDRLGPGLAGPDSQWGWWHLPCLPLLGQGTTWKD